MLYKNIKNQCVVRLSPDFGRVRDDFGIWQKFLSQLEFKFAGA